MRLLVLFILISFSGQAQITSANTRADIKTINGILRNSHGVVSEELTDRFPINLIHGKYYVSFVGKASDSFNADELKDEGVLVGSRIGDIVSIKYPVYQLNQILTNSNFASYELAGRIQPTLNKTPIGTRADSVWAGYGLPEGYTGKDVIIGITDWGFDYTHPMFYDTLLQNSRIIAAWDQFKDSGPAPSGYTYGTEYATLADLLNAGADTANIYSYATHGSHVAGIAAGSGGGTPYRGIAFESEYLFVTFLVDESAVLDAWEWMYNKAQAEGKRLVVNMSWGLYHTGALDGTSVLSQALDAYTDQGVLFVTSAGNNGDVNFHLQHDFSNDTIVSGISFYNSSTLTTLWGQSIHAWGDAGNSISMGVRIMNNSNQVLADGPMYSTITTTSYIDTFIVVGIDTIFYNLSADDTYPTNGRPQIRMRVKRPPSGYKVGMVAAAPTGSVHFWNVTELTSDVGNWGMPFISAGVGTLSGDKDYGIGAPACTHTAISVAAYNSEFYLPNGTLVGGAGIGFSSYGPLMTDSLKPDVTAPGVSVASSISSYTDASFTQLTSVDFNGRTYPFARLSGTSMSSPATAGVAALILDANPSLSPYQVKEIILQTARTDQYTGAIPPFSTKWGWGKVNAYAAVQLALNTVGIEEIPNQKLDWGVYPNPTTGELTISGLSGDEKDVTVINALGEVISKPASHKVIDCSSFESGVYFLRVIRNGKVEQVRFVKSN